MLLVGQQKVYPFLSLYGIYLMVTKLYFCLITYTCNASRKYKPSVLKNVYTTLGVQAVHECNLRLGKQES